MFFATEKEKKIISDILSRFPYTFYLFGSRAKGTARRLSDLDICFFEEIPESSLLTLEDNFENSELPFTVDIVNWKRCSFEFKAVIKKDLYCIQLGRDKNYHPNNISSLILI